MQLLKAGMGSTRPEITHKSLFDLRIPIIPITKQKYFNKELKNILNQYYKNISKIDECKKDAEVCVGANGYDHEKQENKICKVFSIDKIDLNNIWVPKRYKPDTFLLFKEVQKKFNCKRLGEIAKIQRGKGTRVKEYQDSGIHFIRTSSLINHSFDPFPDHYASLETYEDFGQYIKDGDIIYTIEGKIGFVCMLMNSFPIVFKNHIELIRLKPKLNNYTFEELSGWIYLMLSGYLGQCQAEMNKVVQSTIPGLGSRLRQFIVPIESKSEDKNTEMKNLGKTAYNLCKKNILLLKKLNDLQTEFDHYIVSSKNK